MWDNFGVMNLIISDDGSKNVYKIIRVYSIRWWNLGKLGRIGDELG